MATAGAGRGTRTHAALRPADFKFTGRRAVASRCVCWRTFLSGGTPLAVQGVRPDVLGCRPVGRQNVGNDESSWNDSWRRRFPARPRRLDRSVDALRSDHRRASPRCVPPCLLPGGLTPDRVVVPDRNREADHTMHLRCGSTVPPRAPARRPSAPFLCANTRTAFGRSPLRGLSSDPFMARVLTQG